LNGGALKSQLASIQNLDDELEQNLSISLDDLVFIGVFKDQETNTVYSMDLHPLNLSVEIAIDDENSIFGVLQNGFIHLVNYSFSANSFVCSIPKNAFKSCKKCGINYFLDVVKGSCFPCPVGKHSDQEGALECVSCRSGTWSRNVGSDCDIEAGLTGSAVNSFVLSSALLISVICVFQIVLLFARKAAARFNKWLSFWIIFTGIDFYLDLIFLVIEPFRFQYLRIVFAVFILAPSISFTAIHLLKFSPKFESLSSYIRTFVQKSKEFKPFGSLFNKNDHIHKLLIYLVYNVVRLLIWICFTVFVHLLVSIVLLSVAPVFFSVGHSQISSWMAHHHS
jgi:hypothetical protein